MILALKRPAATKSTTSFRVLNEEDAPRGRWFVIQTDDRPWDGPRGIRAILACRSFNDGINEGDLKKI